MRKVVVAMDSMKGCLDSLSASRALAAGISDKNADVEVACVPVADGGEGTAEALIFGNSKFAKQISKVTGPLGKKILAEWYLDEESGIAIMDMAAAAGLDKVDESDRDPLRATTYGVGELITEAVGKGVRKIMLGLGGSATVDGGVGALDAMRFMGEVDVDLVLLCDVSAPFTGERGAARVFGPQKGASSKDVEVLEKRLEELRRLVKERKGIDLNEVPGSGAAGGLAGGLMAFPGGRIVKGASYVLDAIGFDDFIEGADLIVTGEGRSDRQTLMGKIPYEILQSGKRKNIPVWLVAGCVKDRDALLDAGFEKVVCINSSENAERSGTVGRNPMEPEVAKKRLFSMINDKVIFSLRYSEEGD